jgi:hypothetical protein
MRISSLIAGFVGFLLSFNLQAAEPSDELKATLLSSPYKLSWAMESGGVGGLPAVWTFWMEYPGWRGGKIPVSVLAGSSAQEILNAAVTAKAVVIFEANYDKEYAALNGAKFATFEYKGHKVEILHKKSGLCDVQIDDKRYLQDCQESNSEKEAKRIIDAGSAK